MQYCKFNYNFLAFLETKLPFVCNAARIMTIITKNYELPPMCNKYKAAFGNTQTGFVF